MQRWIGLLLLVCCNTCDDSECSGRSGIRCDDALRIEFTSPLRSPGDYKFVVTGALAGECTIGIPSMEEVGCDPALDLETEENTIVGLRIKAAPAALALTVYLDGHELYAFSIAPDYPEADECGTVCRYASVPAFTDSTNGDGGSDADQEPLPQPDASIEECDRSGWAGTYEASYVPIESTCPTLPDRNFVLAEGREDAPFCMIQAITWSADDCTRTTTMECAGEGMTYTWELELHQEGPDASELLGEGSLRVTEGQPICEGSYAVTYRRFPGT